MPQWGILLALSITLTAILELAHLPAALLLGPMVAAIVMSANRATIEVPRLPFVLAQGMVGCLIARAVPVSVFGEIGMKWPLFIGGVFLVIAAAALLGYLLARFRVFPGSTAIWGSSPGAATAMVLMAEAAGADVRLVAFMQYLRVVCVAAVASIVAQFWRSSSHGAEPAATVWFAPIYAATLWPTLAIVAGGVFVGVRFKIPAGPLLVPMLVAVLLQDLGIVRLDLLPWLLAVSYAVVGWSIGLRFTREILVYVAKAFPRIFGSIVSLIAICGGFAALLVWKAGIDPLTAYLATSPGGADSVAIIAASSKVDVPFVMTMQTARFIVVLLVGPSVSRFVAGLSRREA